MWIPQRLNGMCMFGCWCCALWPDCLLYGPAVLEARVNKAFFAEYLIQPNLKKCSVRSMLVEQYQLRVVGMAIQDGHLRYNL